MKFTLVIPTFNEAPVIAATLSGLRDGFQLFYDIDWTILVVDNASTDGTSDAVRKFNHQHVELLRLTEKGKGNAIRVALSRTDADIVGFTDADFPVAPSDIIFAVKLIMNETADIVVGSRLLQGSKTPGREWWRSLSSRMFNFCARHIVGVSASDTQCPLKVMNMKGLKVMLATREPTWFFDLEFLALAERLLLRVVEVPVVWTEHRYPKRGSKLTLFDSLRAIGAMLRIKKRLPAQVALLEHRL